MNTGNTLIASVSSVVVMATIAISPVSAQETSSSSSSSEHLYVHGFRSPSMGLEYRRANLGFHVGRYVTILNQSDSNNQRDTEFLKVGLTRYFGEPTHKTEYFAGVAMVYGRNRDYRNDTGAFLEIGLRQPLAKRLEFRIGAGVLVAPGHTARLNPTPGITYSLPLR